MLRYPQFHVFVLVSEYDLPQEVGTNALLTLGDASRSGSRTCRACLLVAALLGACTSSDQQSALPALCGRDVRPPLVALLDSVILQESDTAFLGKPGASFSIGPNGAMYVPDQSTDRLLVFTRFGTLRAIIGRSGKGPGEFARIGSFGFVDDSVLLQVDGGGRRLNVFRQLTGAFLGTIPYDGVLTWITTNGNDYLFGLTDRGRRHVVATAPAREIYRGEISEGRLIGARVAMPAEYKTYPLLSAWDDTKVVAHADTTVVAFGGLQYLVRYSGPAGVEDTLWIPNCGRKGSPKSLLDEWFTRTPRTREEAAAVEKHTDGALSALLGLWRLADGQLLLWYQDPTWESEGRILKGVAYLSLLSPDLSTVCVDARLEAPGLGRPRLALAGDTVMVLDQVVPKDGPPRAVTVVRRYSISRGDCTPLPTTGSSTAR